MLDKKKTYESQGKGLLYPLKFTVPILSDKDAEILFDENSEIS